MKKIEFRTINLDDLFNNKRYGHWSRFYEYPTVLDFLKKNLMIGSKIHNSAWGFEAPNHTDFKEDLESYFETKNVINSDILISKYPNTTTYNLLDSPKPEWIEYFDCVLNISVIEHLGSESQKVAVQNLYSQVKPTGYFIITFDMPGTNIKIFEEFYGNTLTIHNNKISEMGLTVGLLILQK